jgi:prepilin-type N-terminal cleavage/methylation domain-containing protein
MTRRGLTLLELIVVMTLLGILYAISAVSLATQRPDRSQDSPSESLRARALREGRALRIGSGTPETPWRLFLPDGRTLTATQGQP